MAEILVQVTEEGEIIGPIDRRKAHAEGIIHAVSLIFIFSPGNFDQPPAGGWFQVRSEQKELYPGYLSSTAAGHIQYRPEMTLEQMGEITAREELFEEVGIEIPLTFVTQGFLAVDNDKQVMRVYTGRADSLDIHLQDDEVSEMKKMTLDELLGFLKIGKVTPFALKVLEMIGIIASET